MKRTLETLFIILAIIIAVQAAPARALELPDNVPAWKDMDPEVLAGMLETGDLIAVDRVGDGTVEMVTIGMLADAPPEKVWDVVTDFEGYEELLPNQLQIELDGYEGDMPKVRFIVTVLKLGFIKIDTKYTLKYKLDKPNHVKIDWVEGDVKNVVGWWELHPVDGGKKTVAIYAITSDLASANKFVASALQEQPATVMAINLSSAIIFTTRIMEKVEGRARPSAPEGSQLTWRGLDEETISKLLAGGRAGFVSRVGDREIAVAAVKVKEKPERVWDVLTSFDKYPDRIEQVVKAQVLDKDAKSARVKTKMAILALGPINIGSEGVTKYYFDKPKKMWSEDDKKPRKDLFNQWELVPMEGGAATALVNESVSDISSMGTIANTMLKLLPALQISVDLSQGMIMVDEMQGWAEGK